MKLNSHLCLFTRFNEIEEDCNSIIEEYMDKVQDKYGVRANIYLNIQGSPYGYSKVEDYKIIPIKTKMILTLAIQSVEYKKHSVVLKDNLYPDIVISMKSDMSIHSIDFKYTEDYGNRIMIPAIINDGDKINEINLYYNYLTRVNELGYHKEDKPVVVTLVGSTKFKDKYKQVEHDLSLKGCIVLTCGLFTHADNLNTSDDDKYALDWLHKKKIDISDCIVLVSELDEDNNPYIGSSTKSEMEYADNQNKECFVNDIPKEALDQLIKEKNR